MTQKKTPKKKTAKKTARPKPKPAAVAHIAEELRPLAVPIDAVARDPRNAMHHGDQNVDAIAASLARFGQRQPLVVNRATGTIEAGNGRHQAAESLGWGWVAVLYVDDDPQAATGYAIADNRTAELAEWDDAVLVELLGELTDAGETDLLDALLLADLVEAVDETEAPEPQPERAAELQKEWKTQPRFANAARRQPHVSRNSGNNEWYTPPKYIEAARAAMGGIDCDPASCHKANETVGATEFFDVGADGLSQKWRGRVWMNPPYAQPLVQQFCDAALERYASGEIECAIVLLNNATETAFFQRLFRGAAAACFPEGRIRFIDTDGNPSGAPIQGQAILYLGKSVDQFAHHFSTFGTVVVPHVAGRGCRQGGDPASDTGSSAATRPTPTRSRTSSATRPPRSS